jgi:hypothetical protein
MLPRIRPDYKASRSTTPRDFLHDHGSISEQLLEDNGISSSQERPSADTGQSQPQEDIFDIARVDKRRKDDGLAKIGNYGVGRDAIIVNVQYYRSCADNELQSEERLCKKSILTFPPLLSQALRRQALSFRLKAYEPHQRSAPMNDRRRTRFSKPRRPSRGINRPPPKPRRCPCLKTG